jgi:hypothetical protein
MPPAPRYGESFRSQARRPLPRSPIEHILANGLDKFLTNGTKQEHNVSRFGS